MPFEWMAHPIREQPIKGALASMLVLACGVLVALAVGGSQTGPLAGGGAILFQLLILNRFFLPSRYRIDANGIAVRYPMGSKSMRWSEVTRFRHDQVGGYVSPRRRGGALDSRGISLLFAGHGAEIVELIQGGMKANKPDSAADSGHPPNTTPT